MAELIPTNRELQILKVLWQRREAMVRDVWEALGTESDLAYTTALSLLQFMEKKGLVGHRTRGNAYIYFPRVEQQGILERLASRFLKRVFDGSLHEYLAYAMAGQRPSEKELDQLEEVLAAARTRMRQKRKKGTRA